MVAPHRPGTTSGAKAIFFGSMRMERKPNPKAIISGMSKPGKLVKDSGNSGRSSVN
jgi:hypothetical protein